MKIILIIIFCLAVLFTACEHKINSGIVVHKTYIPAYTTTTIVMSGKTPIPIVTTHPAQYIISIQNGDIVEEFGVSKTLYDSVEVNDSINLEDK